jgi:hypothetical protein
MQSKNPKLAFCFEHCGVVQPVLQASLGLVLICVAALKTNRPPSLFCVVSATLGHAPKRLNATELTITSFLRHRAICFVFSCLCGIERDLNRRFLRPDLTAGAFKRLIP